MQNDDSVTTNPVHVSELDLIPWQTLEEDHSVQAIQAMLRFLPTAVSGVLCNVLVAYLIAIVPTQWIICVGLLSTG